MFNKDRESYKTNTLLIAFTRKIQAVHKVLFFSIKKNIYFLIGRRDLGSVSEYNEDVRASQPGNCVKTPPRDTNKTSLNMETLPQFSILDRRCRGVFNVDTGLSRLSVNKSNHKCQLSVWQTKCSIQNKKKVNLVEMRNSPRHSDPHSFQM